jgi:hypothetical protein
MAKVRLAGHASWHWPGRARGLLFGLSEGGQSRCCGGVCQVSGSGPCSSASIGGVKGKLHDWRIEDREYARQEERRGRRHAYETLLPARTALVVIDMVPFYVSGGGYCLGIVPNISSIAGALRRAGGTVAWVVPAAADRMVVSEEFFGPEVAAVFRRSGGDGPVAGRIWEGLDVHPDDLLAEKTAFSAFFPAAARSRHSCTNAASPPS